MVINNATVEQINVALLDIDTKIKALNMDGEAVKLLQNTVQNIKSSLNETKAGLTGGATYDINISGNASTATQATTATNAVSANTAESAAEAGHATSANTATNANISKTLDTVNGDKLQIGSGTAQNITNAKHAATAEHANTATNALNANTAANATEADHAASADNISAGGASGQVLTSNGSSVAPSWQNPKLPIEPVSFDAIYPIGSIYISVGNVKPAFGEWEKLATGKTLWNDNTPDGREIEAGLPNITGNFSAQVGETNQTKNGAFYNNGEYTFCDSGRSQSAFPNGFGFNASRCSSIYGKSDTVQPPAIAVSMWKRTA